MKLMRPLVGVGTPSLVISELIVNGKTLYHFLKMFYLTGQIRCEKGRDKGVDMQQGAAGWNQTHGLCSKDLALVHGMPAICTEQLGALSLYHFLIRHSFF